MEKDIERLDNEIKEIKKILKAKTISSIVSICCVIFFIIFIIFGYYRHVNYLEIKSQADYEGKCIKGGLFEKFEIIDCQ